MTTFTLPRLDEDSSEGGGSFGALESSIGNLPLKQLQYHVRILGLDVQTTITQTYYNPFDECIEATYVFPLEGRQAVTNCEMWVGDRVVRAELKERRQARQDYRHAILRGHRAALLEANRSELFAMKVGNIPPGEAVQIRICTAGHLPVVRGEWTLRLPLVVAPRYTSGFPLPRSAVENGVTPDTDQVPDASAVTPPTWLPGFASPVDLQIAVDINLGSLIRGTDYVRQIRSSLHTVLVEPHDFSQRSTGKSHWLSVYPGERVDRDFILRGDIDDSEPQAFLMLEPPSRNPAQVATEPGEQPANLSSASLGTFGLHIVPPIGGKPIARDVVFLLDRSGSMAGWKIEAAKRGISRLIDTLSDHDRFAVLAFDHQLDSHVGGRPGKALSWLPATDTNRYQAISWIAKIDARGGTEMGMALQHALRLFPAANVQHQELHDGESLPRSRALVLVTDGQITGEDSVLRLLGTISAGERPQIFCLGVDRAVNASVLQRIADYTGGTFELAESERRLTEVLTGFADEVGGPAIRDLLVKIIDQPEAELSIAPSRQRTLYYGRCHWIYGQVAADKPLRISVRGTRLDGTTWSQELTAQHQPMPDRPTLLPLWGRSRVRELEDRLVADSIGNRKLRDEIVACSLSCNVLCRYTAFVAVDETQRVTSQPRRQAIVQPVDYPAGWRLPPIAPLNEQDRIPVPGKVLRPEGKAASLPASPVDFAQVQVDDDVIELVPESVARENCVLPYAEDAGALTVLMSDPNDFETIEKLRFILNRHIRPMMAPRDVIERAIDQYYGQVAGESVDSMLQEFTDTAIDFTESINFTEATDEMLVAPPFPSAGCDAVDGFEDDPAEVDDEDLCVAPPPIRVRRMVQRSVAANMACDGALAQSPVIRFVDLVIMEAVQLRASHIILTQGEDAVIVTYIIDRLEVQRDRVPLRLFAMIVSRFKMLAKLDVTMGDQPQSGVVDVRIGERRVSCLVHFASFEEGMSILLDLETPAPDPVTASPADLPEAVRAWWQRRNTYLSPDAP